MHIVSTVVFCHRSIEDHTNRGQFEKRFNQATVAVEKVTTETVESPNIDNPGVTESCDQNTTPPSRLPSTCDVIIADQ